MGICWGKFPKFHILDSRLRGNDAAGVDWFKTPTKPPNLPKRWIYQPNLCVAYDRDVKVGIGFQNSYLYVLFYKILLFACIV